MKFYWDNKDLRRDIKALEKMYKEEKNPVIKEEIAYYIAEAKAVILEEERKDCEPNSDLNYLDSLSNIIPIFKIYYPHIDKYRKKLNYYIETLDNLEQSEEKNLKLKKEEIMELVNELYKSIGGIIYDTFNIVYKNRYQNTRYVKESIDFPNMVFIPGLNKPYMTLEEPKLEDYRYSLQAAVHELGHGISSLINPKRYYGEFSFFNEIETTFFELLANDFFSKELNDNGFFQDERERLLANHSVAEDIMLNKMLIDIRYRLGNPDEKYLKKVIKEEPLKSMIDETPGTSFEDDIKYLFSYIIAIELYEAYKKDKKAALEMLKEILTRNEKETEYQNITRIVTPNKSLIKFKNYITKK